MITLLLIFFLPAKGYLQENEPRFAVSLHETSSLLLRYKAVLKEQKTCSCPFLDCQKSQSLSLEQFSLNLATVQFGWSHCVRLTGFAEVHGMSCHLQIAKVQNYSLSRGAVLTNTRECQSGFKTTYQVFNSRQKQNDNNFMRGIISLHLWSLVAWCSCFDLNHTTRLIRISRLNTTTVN